MFRFVFTRITRKWSFSRLSWNIQLPPLIKYKLIAITNQVILQNKLLYIIADIDDGCNVSFLYSKYGYSFLIFYYQCRLQNSLYEMNQMDNCVYYIANGAVFKASLVTRKDKIEAGWSYLGNWLTASVYLVV